MANPQKINKIANDLIRYHGLSERFKLKTDAVLRGDKIGLCVIHVENDGILTGTIHLDKKHVIDDSEDDVIETILHEIAHAITPGAGHSKIWQETATSIGGNGEAVRWCEGTVKEKPKAKGIQHKIFLSGTPIKNHALEYFPALNLLRPDLFPNEKHFARWHVGIWYDRKGKPRPGGLRNPAHFNEITKDFIIRRTREEVAPNLPKITRDYKYFDMDGDVRKAYNMGVDGLDKFLRTHSENSQGFFSKLQGHLMILWHITGLAKTEPILEYCEEYLQNNDEGKVALFVHHVDVGTTLETAFKQWGIPSVRVIAAKHKPYEQIQIFDRFRNDPEIRFAIAPTLASGEGIDLEFCDQGILCEREWNPANEEQVEGRFTRATEEMMAGIRKTFQIIYPVVVNSVDEFFAETVERKRVHMTETLERRRVDQHWSESEVMLEIARRAVEMRKKSM